MGDAVVEVVGANIDGRRLEMDVCMCVNIRNQSEENQECRWSMDYSPILCILSYRSPLNTFSMCRGGKRMVLKPSED